MEQRIESESDSDSSLDLTSKKSSTASTTRLFDPDRGHPSGKSGKAGRWCIDQCDRRGEFGYGWCGFVTSEEAMRGNVKGWASEGKAEGSLDKYVPCE